MSRGGVAVAGLVSLLGVAACSSSSHSPAIDATGGAAGAGSGGAPGGSGGAAGGGAAGTGGVAGSDGGADAEPSLIETIKVQDPSGNPVHGFVFSSTAEGAVFAENWTEQDGTVQLDVPPGGSVSAWRATSSGNDTLRYLTTETRVTQGGTVVLPVVSFLDEPKPTQAVSLQLGALPSGTSSLQVVLPCMTVDRSPSTTVQIDYAYCDESQKVLDILVVATNASGKIIGSATSFANAFSPGEPGPVYNLSFSSALNEMSAAIDGAPSNSNVSLSLGGYRQANPTLLWEQFATPEPSVSHTFELPPTLDRARFQQTVSWTDSNVIRVVERRDVLNSIPATTTWTFPGPAQGVESMKPWDVSNPKRPKWSWTLGMGTPGACIASIHSVIDAAGILFVFRADEATATGFQLPAFPIEIASLAPSAGASSAFQFAGVFSGTSAEESCFPLLEANGKPQQYILNGARIGALDGN